MRFRGRLRPQSAGMGFLLLKSEADKKPAQREAAVVRMCNGLFGSGGRIYEGGKDFRQSFSSSSRPERESETPGNLNAWLMLIFSHLDPTDPIPSSSYTTY